MYVCALTETRVGEPVAVSGPISVLSCCGVPKSCAAAVIRGAAPPAQLRLQTEKRPSGACGAQLCQALTTLRASDHGHSSVHVATFATGWVRKTSRVTIPKFPPPP